MPLNKKMMSYSTSRTAGWLCCLPCSMTTALCCLMCCQVDTCLELSCYPCVDETLTEKAGSIASDFTSCLIETHPKLIELKRNNIWSWDPAKTIFVLFGETKWSSLLYHAIREKVLAILDAYNFGNIASTSLTKEEVKYIGKELKNAIFSKLPSAQDFYQLVVDNRIRTEDLDGYLTGALLSIINEDNFIFNELNKISDNIVTMRASRTSIAAVGLYKNSAPLAESKAVSLNDGKLQPPTYEDAMRATRH